MKHLLYAMLIVICLCGCTGHRHLPATVTTRDSVVVTEVVRDTIITLAPDSSMIQALVECDSVGQARLKQLLDIKSGTNVKPPKVTITENVLTAKVEVDSLDVYMKLKDRYKEHYKAEKIIETVEVNRLTRWQLFRMRLGEAALFAAAGGVAIWLIRKRR